MDHDAKTSVYRHFGSRGKTPNSDGAGQVIRTHGWGRHQANNGSDESGRILQTPTANNIELTLAESKYMNSFFVEMYSNIPAPIRDTIRIGVMKVLDKKMKNFFGQFAGPGKLVIDVGANIGDYTKMYREMGAKVICIEPQPDCVQVLKKKFGHDRSVTIIPAGIGTRRGTLELLISSQNNPVSTFSSEFVKNSRYSFRKWDKRVKVKMITLDEIIRKYGQPDFCKIDVEGFEWEVVSSLKKPIPGLSFEFLSEFPEKSERIIKFLDRLGMKEFNLSLMIDYHFHLKKWVSGTELIKIMRDNKKNDWCGDIYARIGTNRKTK